MKLDFDPKVAQRCHDIAAEISAGVNAELAAFSTETIERTVARLFGVDDLDSHSVPLANVLVDHL